MKDKNNKENKTKEQKLYTKFGVDILHCSWVIGCWNFRFGLRGQILILEVKGHKPKCVWNWPIKLYIKFVKDIFISFLTICIVIPRKFGRMEKLNQRGAPLLETLIRVIFRLQRFTSHGQEDDLVEWNQWCSRQCHKLL